MMTQHTKLFVRFITAVVLVVADPHPCRTVPAEVPTREGEAALKKIRELRKQTAQRKRRLIFHSDGRPMDNETIVFPHLPGTQTDACTYSLIHQFNLARLYRTEVAQPWPPGSLEEYGDGPDDLERYVAFCRENAYEAFWAQRMNDTHDCADTENGRWKFETNNFKQEHPEFLIGERRTESPSSPDEKWRLEDFIQCPHGRWSSVDYAHEEVRELLFRSWEEVCKNYDLDGLMFDFFRHPTFFRSTAWGKRASEQEVEMMTELLRRTRKMADELGAKRGRPFLFIARTPDSPGYCKGLGLDIQRWMEEDLIDIWLATGYHRMQEWDEIVRLGHKHGVPVWASMDESRVPPRELHNTREAYRARAMNMWNAGVDAIYLFNFFYKPPQAQFELLHELGDPAKLAYLDKMYVPDARGHGNLDYWLKDGDAFDKLPRSLPVRFDAGESKTTVNILIGDDLTAARAKGYAVSAELHLQFEELSSQEGLSVTLNDETLRSGTLSDSRIRFVLAPELVKKGTNRIGVAFKPGPEAMQVLTGVRLWTKYDVQ